MPDLNVIVFFVGLGWCWSSLIYFNRFYLNSGQINVAQLISSLSSVCLWLRNRTRRGRTVFPKVCFCRLCMLLSTYAFLFEPCADIKYGLTIAHCPVSPPRFLSCQNSRKLGHRANKQRRPRLSAGASGASGSPGRTLERTAGVGGRNPARKLISSHPCVTNERETYFTLCMKEYGKGGGKGLQGGGAAQRFGSEKWNQE